MSKQAVQNKVVIYQAKNGAIELRGDATHETIWATQAQIAEVFGVERSVVTKHIKNIYKEQELSQDRTCAKIAQVQTEGGRSVERTVEHYNLDLIISVGYRVNSKTATQFRQWATSTLRAHITKGYTINRKQVAKNYDAFLKSVADIQALLPEHVTLDPKGVLDLIKEFATTWVSLDAYDREQLTVSGVSKKSVRLTSDDLHLALAELKRELMKKVRRQTCLPWSALLTMSKALWVTSCSHLAASLCIHRSKRRPRTFCTLWSRIIPSPMATNAPVPLLLYGFSVRPASEVVAT